MSSVCRNDNVDLLLDHIMTEAERLDASSHLPKLVSKLAEHIRTHIPQDPPAHLTKLEQAYAIYDSMPGAARIDVIATIMRMLTMTKAGASSYYAQARLR